MAIKLNKIINIISAKIIHTVIREGQDRFCSGNFQGTKGFPVKGSKEGCRSCVKTDGTVEEDRSKVQYEEAPKG